MTSIQYEELCRVYIAEQFKIPSSKVTSERLENPAFPGDETFKHQVDLVWTVEDAAVRYFNIANAKWRGTEKVDQGEIGLLQWVRGCVKAHKALMIGNTDFTEGARKAAEHEGIGLHVVRPDFAVEVLPRTTDRVAIQNALASLAASAGKPLYDHTVVFRALEPAGWTPSATSPDAAPVSIPVVHTRPVTTTVGAPPSVNRGPGWLGGGFTRGGVRTR